MNKQKLQALFQPFMNKEGHRYFGLHHKQDKTYLYFGTPDANGTIENQQVVIHHDGSVELSGIHCSLSGMLELANALVAMSKHNKGEQ